MRISGQKRATILYAVAAVIVVGGFVFWVSDLTSDPPMYFSGTGQSLGTDPLQYVHHARNQVLFGDWTPFDYARWTVYQHSITSATAYIVFSIAGVSLYNANLVGALLSIGGLILLLLGIGRWHRPWVTVAVAICYVASLTLLTYGRLGYLENGLVFLSCATFAVYSLYGSRTWGAALTGACIGAAMLTGKLFGFLLLPAVVVSMFFLSDRRWRDIGLAGGGFAVSFLLLTIVLYSADFAVALGYVGEQSLGLYGFPEGLSSPWGFFEKLIPYGFRNRLYFLTPELLYFLVVGGMILACLLAAGVKLRKLSRSTVFLTMWAGFGILGLSVLNYSPLRYSLLFIPGLIGFGFAIIDDALRQKTGIKEIKVIPTAIILVYICWTLSFNVGATLFYFNVIEFPNRMLTWSSLPFGLALAGLLFALIRRGILRLSGRRPTVVVSMAVLAIGLALVHNSIRIYQRHIAEQNYNILEANTDMAVVLGSETVLSGPYAPALTINNRHHCFIHLFGVADVDETLFDRYPVTHFACDVSNWQRAVQDYPQLGSLKPIATMWIRNFEIKVYPVYDVFDNPQASDYSPTDYERAFAFNAAGHADSAYALIAPFYASHRESKSTAYLYAEVATKLGRVPEAMSALTYLAQQYPTDFFVHMNVGRLMQILAHQQGNQSMLNQAQAQYARAVDVNPYAAGYASNVWNRLNQALSAQRRQGQPPSNPGQ